MYFLFVCLFFCFVQENRGSLDACVVCEGLPFSELQLYVTLNAIGGLNETSSKSGIIMNLFY